MAWSSQRIPITGEVAYWTVGNKDYVKVAFRRKDNKPWKPGVLTLHFEFRLEDDEVWMEPPESESYLRQALDEAKREAEEKKERE